MRIFKKKLQINAIINYQIFELTDTDCNINRIYPYIFKIKIVFFIFSNLDPIFEQSIKKLKICYDKYRLI